MKKLAMVAAAAISLSAGVANADPGDELHCGVIGSLTCSPFMAFEGAGAEFQIGNLPSETYFDVDFDGAFITITALATNSLSLSLTFLNLANSTHHIEYAALVEQSGFVGLDASDISLSVGMVQIDMRNTSSVVGAYYKIALVEPAAGVPEPAAWAMLIGGFGLAGAATRRRAKVSFA